MQNRFVCLVSRPSESDIFIGFSNYFLFVDCNMKQNKPMKQQNMRKPLEDGNMKIKIQINSVNHVKQGDSHTHQQTNSN